MFVFGKSIVRRIFIYFLVFGAVLAGSVFYAVKSGMVVPDVNLCAEMTGVILLFVLLVYLFEFARPVRVILKQMKSLLAGKIYKKIYTKRNDELGVMAHFFNEVTRSFEKVSVEIKEGKRMMNELEIASSIQRAILPPQNPIVPGLDVDAKTRPAAELGGDVFDFISTGENTFIYIGDVTGHGVPAAIVMTMVNTLIRTLSEIYRTGYEIVTQANRQVKNRIKSTMFMTLLLFKWDHKQQKMTFTGAGHEHVVVYKAGIGKCMVQKTGGIALGMVPDNTRLIKEIELPLDKDDVIVLYSDGLTEGRNMAGEMYGLDRLVKAVELYAPQYGSDGIVHHVALDYSRFVQEHVQDDDVTLIAMKFVGVGQEEKTPVSGVNTETLAWLAKDDNLKAKAENDPGLQSPIATK
jgi:serine phosphatase RsbU (regulator of sigma subunit)